MQKFHLELLCHIIGIGSASGLFYKDHSIFLISDNGGYLYEYHLSEKTLEKNPIIEYEVLENILKKTKPDFEALVNHGDTVFAFGSGSTENRNRMIQFDQVSKTVTATVDLTNLYAAMQSFGNIKPADFNIEGVAYNGETWYFFQRGNGGTGKNGVFTVAGKNLEYDFSILYNELKLPKIKGVRTSFTDAVFVGDQIYFLATAEDTQSAYDDGDVLGSLIGILDPKKMKITSTQKITDKHKLEGITVMEKTATSITFLICEDNDTDLLESDIYKLILTL